MTLKFFFRLFTSREKGAFIIALFVLILSFFTRAAIAFTENSIIVPAKGGIYHEGAVGQPVNINPVVSFNPIDKDISALVFGFLGDVISNYEIKDDGRIYTIKIIEGLKWSDGKPFTSDDIIFTVKTIQNPEVGSPLYKKWLGVTVERVSELQVQFVLPTPYTFFTEDIKKLQIIPLHIFKDIPAVNFGLSQYKFQPVGAGPYKFKSFTKKKNGFIKEYCLELNENYSKKQAFIDEFCFSFFETEQDLLSAFRFYKIDGFGIPTVFSQKIYTDARDFHIIPMSRYYAVFLNSNVGPLLQDKAIRIALQDAIDKEQIIREVFQDGLAKSAYSPMINSNRDFKRLSFEQVKETLQKVRSQNQKLYLTLYTPKLEFLEKTAKIIKENWEKAGVQEVSLVSLPLDELFNNIIKTNNYEAILFGNTLENSEDIFPFWHSSQRFYPGLNLSLYKNPQADTLMEKIRQIDNKEEREKELTQLEQLIIDEVPALFLFSLPYSYISRLRGIEMPEHIISSQVERFEKITGWHIKTVRVIKNRK